MSCPLPEIDLKATFGFVICVSFLGTGLAIGGREAAGTTRRHLSRAATEGSPTWKVSRTWKVWPTWKVSRTWKVSLTPDSAGSEIDR